MAHEFQQQHQYITQKYASNANITVTFKPGHTKTQGRTANQMKNPIWEIMNTRTGEVTELVMYCEPNQYCQLCPASYQKILEYEATHNKGEKMTWYRTQNGYISCHSNNVFIHQVIMDTWGQGNYTANTNVVAHLDRNPLNNRYDNLHISTLQEHQKYNTAFGGDTKRERRNDAKELPPGLTQDMMKRYVTYNHEWLDKEHMRSREYFKVDHPKLEKPWVSSKSEKVPLLQKLEHANKVVSDLEKGIFPDATACATAAAGPETALPKYISFVVKREKPHLVYERKRPEDGVREEMRMVLPANYILKDEIVKLKQKVEAKYGVTLE